MNILGDLRSGSLDVVLARTDEEVQAALSLRYRVFYEEMGAKPSPEMAARRQDFDAFDPVADHLLVIDHDLGTGPAGVVGCYRLLRKQAMERVGRFYSADEYDLTPILSYDGNVMELGRSCVDSSHRNRPTMQMLWRGITAYVNHYDIALMFGCASLPGTDLDSLAPQLSYLYQYHLAPECLRVQARPERFLKMDLLPRHDLNERRIVASLPPLVKGYLRLGGFFGDGAVVDQQFNTTDVFVIVKTDLIGEKYIKHYGRAAPC